MSNKAAQLAALYARIPKMVGCTGQCWQSCGPVIQLGMLTPYEAVRLRDVERVERDDPTECELLTEDHRCRGYADRPYVCRAWGTLASMPCPFTGCRPERVLDDSEADDIRKSIIALSGAEEFLYGQRTRNAMAMIHDVIWRRRGKG